MHPFAAFTSAVVRVVRLFFACPPAIGMPLLPGCSHGRKAESPRHSLAWFGIYGARGPSGRREARHCSAGGEAEEQCLEDLRGEVSVQQRAVRIPTQVRLHAEEAAQIILTTGNRSSSNNSNTCGKKSGPEQDRLWLCAHELLLVVVHGEGGLEELLGAQHRHRRHRRQRQPAQLSCAHTSRGPQPSSTRFQTAHSIVQSRLLPTV